MRPRLLLADERTGLQESIEGTFSSNGFEVVVARSGAEAIALAAGAPRPDIVLVDAALRDADGAAVSAVIRHRADVPDVPIVLLADGLDVVDHDRMRQAGGDGVLARPIDPQAALSLVRTLLERTRRERPAVPADGAMSALLPERGGWTAADPLEAYFSRLDAAFAAFAASPSGGRDGSLEHAPDGRAEPDDPAQRGPADPGASGTPVADGVERWEPSFANAFVSMFAPESGERAPTPALAIPDDLIEEIVRRVIGRLGEASMRRLVIDTAERMVREEIERIKGVSGSGPAHPVG